MATIRKMWDCKNSLCKNPKTGRHRGYRKVYTGEKKVLCKHCQHPMVLSENYQTRVQIDGEVRTKTLSADKKFAADYVAECRTAARVGNLLPGEEIPLSWVDGQTRFEAWLDDPGANNNLSAKTILFYRGMLKPLRAHFGKMNLQDIQKKDVDAFKSAEMKKVGESAVNGRIATLKRMYSVICGQERAALTPRLHEAMVDVHKVKLLELDNEVDIILESEEEMQILLSHCKTPHLYHFVFGILNTGLRHNDMLKLRISEVSFPRNEIRTTVKGGVQVEIPISGPYRRYIEEWIKNMKIRALAPKDYLIPSRKNEDGRFKPESNIGFEKACENAAGHYESLAAKAATKQERQDLKAVAERFRQLTPHCLRHTFATHFLYKTSKTLGATAAVHILSKMLGHSTTYITERYAHVLRDVHQAAMAEFGSQMFSAAESP